MDSFCFIIQLYTLLAKIEGLTETKGVSKFYADGVHFVWSRKTNCPIIKKFQMKEFFLKRKGWQFYETVILLGNPSDI